MKNKIESHKIVPSWRLFLLTFALSAVMLAYEIMLTRITSVLLTNQYVFLIVGVSLLGISIGAIVEYFYSQTKSPSEGSEGVPLPIAAFPIIGILIMSLALVLAIYLIVKAGPTQGITIIALSAALPFAASGFVFSRLFRLFPPLTSTLYASDLFGAAVGALSFPALIEWLGPVEAILLLATVLAVIALISTAAAFNRWVLTIPALIVVGVLFLLNSGNGLFGDVPIGRDPNKDEYRLITMAGNSAKIIDSRWSAFGRTDLVRFSTDTSSMAIFVDGAAGASMFRFSQTPSGNGSFADSTGSLIQSISEFGGMLPLSDLPDNWKNSALVIGPGGGRDVLVALKAGYKHVTAVDINPQMISIVKDYSGYNGGIYTRFRNVHVIVSEGRNYVRQSNKQYDLITLFMPITKSSQSMNAFALSESYLFTKQAFKDYYDHLTNNGMLLVMAHNVPEVAKIMTTAVAALKSEGMTVQQAMNRMFILGSDMMPFFGLRKEPLQDWEMTYLHTGVHSLSQFDPQISYIPGAAQQMKRLPLTTNVDPSPIVMNPVFISLADGKLPLTRLETGTGLNLVPATDNRPFFFQYDFSLPPVLSTMLWLSLGLLLGVFFIPTSWFKSGQGAHNSRHRIRKFPWWLPVFFIAIGLGYIIVELSLFQKLVFYLGDPSRSLALLFAALLAGSGIGSLLSARMKPSGVITFGIVSAVLAVVFLFAIPYALDTMRGVPVPTLEVVAAIILFLQGIPMGLMFPIGLRLAERLHGGPAIPWMWAINGSASVVGSTLAIIIAMTYGYNWSLVSGAVAYLVAALSVAVIIRNQVDDNKQIQKEV